MDRRYRAVVSLDEDGRNALHHAAVRGEVDVLASLPKRGDHDLDLADRQGFTPLHFAAQQGDLEAVRLLLVAGASVDPQDSRGNTPLWRAVFGNNAVAEIVQLLLAAGADPDITNNSGRSPRDMAATFNKAEIVSQL